MPGEKLHPTAIDRGLTLGAKFLRGVSINPRVRSILESVGYTEEQHQELWGLYLTLMGNDRKLGNSLIAAEAKAAIEDIDASDEPLFKLAHFSLFARFPEQDAKLFDKLSPQTGYDSVVAMQTFLERLQALREGSPQDQAAAELLRSRPILTADREAELLQAIEVAKGLNRGPTTPTNDDAYQEAARAFLNHLREWRGIASVLIKRKDDRIMLGLSKRRSTKAEVVVVDEEEGPELDGPLPTPEA
ncbi:MAG: hypothetical protein RBU37_18460 [Myxococcota bacterium]|jgi:hypothetical protein|nr:hypothetical protein [Myxococcota bacterium]